MDSLSLLQQIFPTQESKNWGLLRRRRIFYQLSYQGSPIMGTLLNVLLPPPYPHSPVFIPLSQALSLGTDQDEEFRMGLVCVPALPLANLVHPSPPHLKNGDKDVSYPRGSL